MNLFFFNELKEGSGILTDEEAKHCSRTLRCKAGDEIYAVDGSGNGYLGKITVIGKSGIEVRIIKTFREWGEHPYSIRMIVSPLRLPDRFEWLIEKAVELGVTAIHPVVMERTVKPTIRESRLNAIMISAIKQSIRSRLPELAGIESLANFLRKPMPGMKLIAMAGAETSLNSLADQIRDHTGISLLAGPEGDFTEAESGLAIASGFVPVGLGKNRLRSETAVLHLLSSVKQMKGF